MEVIVANKNGTELRYLLYDTYDFEVGREENSFEIVIRREEYEYIPPEARIYIPDTELGGLFRRLTTDTENGTITVGGYTWRGMLQKKIIQPPSGQDYATSSGELNAIIKAKVEAAFPNLFYGVTTSTGVSVTNYQYNRYCTLEEGLVSLLQSKGYRLDIQYSQTDKGVIVQAVPIIDYTELIEFSSDMQNNYIMEQQGDGVNHLICLGNGELKNRTVYHYYINKQGKVSTTQAYFGVDEIAAVYDSGGSELPDLKKDGKEQIIELANHDNFSIKVDPSLEIAIGDIVGGRDYLSKMTMSAPVWSKIIRFSAGFTDIEYTLEYDRMNIEEEQEELRKSTTDIQPIEVKKEDQSKTEDKKEEPENNSEVK